MPKDIATSLMLIVILAVIALALILWMLEAVPHQSAVLAGLRKTFGSDDVVENSETDDDPYDVGMNDTRIL